MYARAVRFTGVNQETVDRVRQRVEESDGPPPGVKSTAMKLLFDADQGTAIFVGFFANDRTCAMPTASSRRWTRETPPEPEPRSTAARS